MSPSLVLALQLIAAATIVVGAYAIAVALAHAMIRQLERRRALRAVLRALDAPTTHDASGVFWAHRRPRPKGPTDRGAA